MPSQSTISWMVGLLLLAVCVGASGMLVLQHFGRLELPGCGPESGCAEAAASFWGSIGPWPVSFVGLAYFAGLAAAWAMAGCPAIPRSFRWLVRTGALVSVLYLAVIVVHQHYCSYCLAAHAANLGFWLLVELRGRAWRRAPSTSDSWQPAITTLAGFALVSALLNVAESEQRRFAMERAERDVQTSIDQIVAASRGADAAAQASAADGAAHDRKPSDGPERLASDQAEPAGKTKANGSDDAAPRNSARVPYRLGPEQAAIRLEIFSDYQCVHCQRIERDVQTLLRRYADVLSLTVRHYPLCTECNYSQPSNVHPNACRAARAVEAAGLLEGNDGFWKMHHWVYEQKGNFTDQQLRQALPELGYEDPELFLETMNGKEALRCVLQDILEAESREIIGTPLIFINGVRLRGWEAKNAVVRAVVAVAEQQGLLPVDEAGKFSVLRGQTALPSGFSSQLERTAVTATVRIINRSQGSTGSGAIIGNDDSSVYILTAQHVVDRAEELEIHTFSAISYPEPSQVYPSAEVVAVIQDADLALVRLATADRMPSTLRVCPLRRIPQDSGFAVVTVGCSGEGPPSCLADQVNARKLVRRGDGRAATLVWELDAQPAQGRSGGPMVDQQGYLLGVASGTSDGKGYYSHTEEIHKLLQRAGRSPTN